MRRLAFGNELHDAQTCLALGVFDEVVEPDAVLPRAQEIARELAALPADVYARTKADLRGATIERLRAAAADDPLRRAGSRRPAVVPRDGVPLCGRSVTVARSAVRSRGRAALVAFGEGEGEPFA